MGKITDKTGERNINNFGSEMIIVGYRKYSDIDVYFPQYDWVVKNRQYSDFKRGNIKCPYEKRYYGIGYIGEGKFKVYDKNGKITKCFRTWQSMLQRCYDEKFHKKCLTYDNCEVCEEWLNFQNFGKWFYKNYYKIEGEKICLDKDILVKGNKIYSPDTCIFVPERINTLFTKCNKIRGDYPIGVYYNERNKKFVAQCSIYNYNENKKKPKYLGLYDAPEEAFEVYKQFKENYIKEIADKYKQQIPRKLYQTMCNYKVEIND